MLKKLRIIIAAIFFAGLTLLMLDISGALHTWLGWMAKIQFIPAVLALNAAVIAGLVILTLLFGRAYCSFICPLGITQDIINWFSTKRKGKKARFAYKKPVKTVCRYLFLAAFIVLIVLGFTSIAMIIEPYSTFGRTVTNLLGPLYGWCNNLLAAITSHFDSYAFYSVDVFIKSLPAFIVAAAVFVIIFIMAWKGGREWCNTVCPVGTVLGLISRISLFKPVIDTDKCVNCGVCGKKCKGSCIDTANHAIDYSRCVVCMDCINNCSQGAIRYTARRRKNQESSPAVDTAKRSSLAIVAMAASAATLKAAEEHVDGGFAVLEDKKVPAREVSPKPAGSQSVKNFTSKCTACQLCVAECPNHVLRPSTKLETFMQPEMSYERGYCRPECTRCSEVCPAGAIKKITREEKSSIQIGHAVWIPDNCVVNTDGVECGNCARHCPVGAIRMMPLFPGQDHSLRIPSINTERCIGCGACENLCPVRPLSAIYVEGHKVHKEN